MKKYEFNESRRSFFLRGTAALSAGLFSATAGQIADKFEKSVLIQRIKILEIIIIPQ